jgi:hypothetical protein
MKFVTIGRWFIVHAKKRAIFHTPCKLHRLQRQSLKYKYQLKSIKNPRQLLLRPSVSVNAVNLSRSLGRVEEQFWLRLRLVSGR